MITRIWAVGMLTLSSTVFAAEPISFNFKDPKGVNSIGFTLDSELEPIRGFAGDVSGRISFDPAKPEATSGALSVPTRSLITPNDGMTRTLWQADWLDAESHPEITFAFKEVTSVGKAGDNAWDLNVKGELTIRGETRELTVPVRASYLEGALEKRQRAKGDLLVLRSSFSINRKDFGIKPDQGPAVVAEDIQLRVQIVGIHPRE